MVKEYYCIGIMSGTSLDGVDLVYVKLSAAKKYDYQIITSLTKEYSDNWKTLLKEAFDKSLEDLEELDHLYGSYLGELVIEFVKQNAIAKVDFVASHGHTIFHKPEQGFTLQIGSGKEISRVSNFNVVCDFRSQDVALGGQGAPLVPIGDALLFSDFDYCLNLGGFANVSFVDEGVRKAFDICPVNIVLNHYTMQVGNAYDDKGQLALKGKVCKALLKELNTDPFYELTHPKSLGYEFVKQNVLPLIDSYNLEINDVLSTVVEHIAIQMSYVLNKKTKATALVTGGGVYNEFLLERIRALSSIELIVPSTELIEFKEALIFAFLGLLKINGQINCLKSVTGASKDHSSGRIFRV